MRGYSFQEIAVLCLVLLLAAGLRYHRATAGGISFDEMWHVELSAGNGSPHSSLPTDQLITLTSSPTSLREAAPIWKIWTSLSSIVHPPLYILALRAWREALGEGDLPARMLSVVCGLIAILLLYDAVRTMHGVGPARAAVLIFALASTQTYLGQQVRGYAMLQMWGCGALAAMARLEKRGPKLTRAVALGICAFGLAFTHYFGLFAGAALLAYSPLRLRGAAMKQALFALATVALLFVITWFPFMLRQRATANAAFAEQWLRDEGVPLGRHLLLTLGRMAAIPVRQISEPPSLVFDWPIWIGGAFLILAVATAWLGRRSDLLLWIIWLAGTIGVLALLDATRGARQLVYSRYTILAAPAVFALIAALGAPLRNRAWRSALPLLALIYALSSLLVAYTRQGEAEWQALGSFIDMNAAPGETLIFHSGTQQRWYRDFLLLGAMHYSHHLPAPVVKLSRPADRELVASLPGQTAWLITGRDAPPPEQLIPGARAIRTVTLPSLAQCTQVLLPATATGAP